MTDSQSDARQSGNPPRVLVTGGAGFLGSHLVDHYLERDSNVVALDTQNFVFASPNPRMEIRLGTLLDADLVDDLVQSVDLVYHLGAAVGLQNVVGRILEVIEVNVRGTENVLVSAARHGKRVLFASTSEIAGRSPKVPFSEDDERVMGPISKDRWVYAETKALGEYMCQGYARAGLDVSIVRLFNAYGPRLDPSGTGRVVSRFIHQISQGVPVTVIGTGEQTRCFTYVSDVVRGIVLAGELDAAVGRTFNLGSPEEVSIMTILKHLFRLMGRETEVRHVDAETLYGPGYEDIERRVPDTNRARTVLGFEAEVPLVEGLTKTVEWFQRDAAAS